MCVYVCTYVLFSSFSSFIARWMGKAGSGSEMGEGEYIRLGKCIWL